MALAAERAKYGLPAEFKVTREMKKTFTPQEKTMYKTAYEIGGAKRANEVMRSYFAKKKAAIAREAAEANGTAGPSTGGGATAIPDLGVAAAPKPKPVPEIPKELTEVPLGETGAAGHLFYAGTVDWDNIGKKTAETGTCLYTFTRLMAGIKVRLVAAGAVSCHAVCVDEVGGLYAWGRNDCGQLGMGDHHARAVPVKVKHLESYKIRHASCGRRHTLVCTEDGAMFSWGQHKMGQLGTGGKVNDGSSTPVKVATMTNGSPVTRVACGGEFNMAVNEDGQVAAWGHPMYGQLGNRTNGEYIEKAGAISYHFELAPILVKFDGEQPKIVDVACGTNHTVCMSDEGTIYTWGFGGYGRLGHNSQKDLDAPLEVETFNVGKCRNPRMGAKMICAGATCSYANTRGNQMFFWGRTKSSGEATMYPKPVYDLNGWNVRNFACGYNSTFVAADNSVISWGPSPTYGELGYGEPDANNPKSSTKPKLVESLEGMRAGMVASGQGFAMVIAEDTEQNMAIVNKAETYEPDEIVIIAEGVVAEPAKGKKRTAETEPKGGKKGKK